MEGIIGGTIGAFAGALAITFLVFGVCKKYTDTTRKGLLKAFVIALLFVWGLRIAVWQILNNGYEDISLSLICYTLALMVWMVRDYKNTKPLSQSPQDLNSLSSSGRYISSQNAIAKKQRLAEQMQMIKQSAIEARQYEKKTDTYQAALDQAEKKSLEFLIDNAMCVSAIDSQKQQGLYAWLLVYLTTYKAWKDSKTDIHQSYWNTFQRRIELEMLNIKDYGHVDSRIIKTPNGGEAFAHFSSNYRLKMDELANLLDTIGLECLTERLLNEMKSNSELEGVFISFFNGMSNEAESSLVKMIADLA